MFGLLRNFYRWYKSRNEKIVKFALIGIDNAGKTTILARLKGEVPEFITPTIGFASETIEQGRYHIKIFDLGGGANIRTIWSSYYAEIHGAIFVVDSADKNRLAMAREVLHAALDHSRLQGKPLLIFSNKQDLPEALPGPEISEELALDKYTDYSYNIVSCSAVLVEDGGLPDPNISEGLKWLLDMTERHFPSLEKRILADVAEQAEQDRIEKEEKKKRIEAMRRERELERERQEKEEAQNKEKEQEQEKVETKGEPKEWQPSRMSQSIIEIHPETSGIPAIPSSDGISMTKADFKSSSSPHLNNVSSSRKSLSRSSPRASATVAPLPEPPRTPDATQEAVAFTPRSAWSTAAHVPSPNTSKRKLEPLTLLPSPSLQGL